MPFLPKLKSLCRFLRHYLRLSITKNFQKIRCMHLWRTGDAVVQCPYATLVFSEPFITTPLRLDMGCLWGTNLYDTPARCRSQKKKISIDIFVQPDHRWVQDLDISFIVSHTSLPPSTHSSFCSPNSTAYPSQLFSWVLKGIMHYYGLF